MNVLEAITAMQGYFDTQWSDTPILWGGDDPTKIPNETFVRFNILHNEGTQVTMGDPNNNRHRRFGTITIQIFQPEGAYGVEARTHAKNILSIYTGLVQSDIIYRNPILREVGNDGHGWYQINVVMNFQYDEIT